MTDSPNLISRTAAVSLLQGLVAIPSVSRQEADASRWLSAQMLQRGYDRAYVDEAGNAVGEMGPTSAKSTIVLLGHIDTVPGDIPVRVEESEEGPILFGRGSVDAKGPLATFTAAVASLGSAWAAANNIRLVVVGAVEEEAATSKGARFIRDRFNGVKEPVPDACIIGEPSGWQRVTLGYKGRVLVDMEARQPMAHTAGPDAGVGTVAVDFWNAMMAYVDSFNESRPRAFDQLLPSLRELHTWTDDAMQDRVRARTGIRLPLDFDTEAFIRMLADWTGLRAEAAAEVRRGPTGSERDTDWTVQAAGPRVHITLRFHSLEPAWRSDRNNALVRSFLAAIRAVGDAKPGFVVKTGTSDMNVVGPAWRCPILAYGPGDSRLDHTPNEHIPLNEYWQAVLVLRQALLNLVG
jgi:LysW-gamma-L-lysine carboxypeptidase